MMEHGVTPVWVFDGQPLEEKSETIKKREGKKKAADRLLEESLRTGDYLTAMKASKQSITMKEGELSAMKTLLELAGVPFAVANSEADFKMARLSKSNAVAGVISEDGDLLAHGVETVLRSDKPGSFIAYEKSNVLKVLGMSENQFVDLCILLGNDYIDNAEGVGPISAYKLIKEHGSIEKILETNTKFNLDDLKSKYQVIRKIYTPLVNNESDTFEKYDFNEKKFKEFLKERKFKGANIEKYAENFKKLHESLKRV